MKPIVIASHRRAGTHFVADAIRANWAPGGRRPEIVPLESVFRSPLDTDGTAAATRREIERRRREGRPMILKTHCPAGFPEFWAPEYRSFVEGLLGAALIVRVTRSPLDVLRSLRRYVCGLEGQQPGGSLSEFAMAPSRFYPDCPALRGQSNAWVLGAHVGGWAQAMAGRPNCAAVSFEALSLDYARALSALFGDLGLALPRRWRDVRGLPGRWRRPWTRWLWPADFAPSAVNFGGGLVGRGRAEVGSVFHEGVILQAYADGMIGTAAENLPMPQTIAIGA